MEIIFLMEEKRPIRTQNFREKPTFQDLFARMPDMFRNARQIGSVVGG
jgi:hypothetical protein